VSSRDKKAVLQLRVALTVQDFERSATFYSEGLGIEPAALWSNNGGRAIMLDMGRATLEIFDQTQAQAIDEIEVGRPVGGQFRFAVQVPDLRAAMDRLLERGATLVHEPVLTPWGDLNARLQDPDGVQITLFQHAGSEEYG
jgi:catechol 2,3-dioxygenase-like lactoylglutathione lyase family enzyme